MTKRIVIESPLRAETPEGFARNFRFLLWCCRAVYERECVIPIASHLVCPWFMDDRVSKERDDGIAMPWVWQPGTDHWFFLDLGVSKGMALAADRCTRERFEHRFEDLSVYAPDHWAAFERGEWPPPTPGFELAR